MLLGMPVYKSLCGCIFSYLLGIHKKITSVPYGTLSKVLANCQSIFARWGGAFFISTCNTWVLWFLPSLVNTYIVSFITAMLMGARAAHCDFDPHFSSGQGCWSSYVLIGIFRQFIQVMLNLGHLCLYYWVAIYPHISIGASLRQDMIYQPITHHKAKDDPELWSPVWIHRCVLPSPIFLSFSC